MSHSFGLESVLDIIRSEMYGCEVIATEKCDLELIGTEKVFL